MEAFDELGRPHPDLYWMNVCFDVNWKSFDPSSKHGCVSIAPGGSLITSGYNGPIRGSDDKSIPLTRPEKYAFMEHSERNCIYNAAREGKRMLGCTFYVTGLPCVDCMRAMVQVGAVRIVYGPYHAAMMHKPEDIAVYDKLLAGQKVRVERFQFDAELFEKRLDVLEMVNIKRQQGISDVNLSWIPEEK